MGFLDDWTFDLPDAHIARRPVEVRSQSRLMHLPLTGGPPEDHRFDALPGLLRSGDLLVVNDTRVMAARLHARRSTGGKVELLVLEPGPGPVEVLARGAKRLKDGEVLEVEGGGQATVHRVGTEGGTLRVTLSPDPETVMARAGAMPLPPYMERPADQADAERYQTVYAGPLGAAAAPTAGLHFTPELLARLAEAGIVTASVTLHVGIGTFRPLRPEDVEAGELHPEPWSVPSATVDAIAATRAAGGRVVAVGTTSVRTLEACAVDGVPAAGSGVTRLFLSPPDRLSVVDGLITNFHLPRSSLLMLVACLVGRERLLDSYRQAVRRDYRFYSYGDAMLLL